MSMLSISCPSCGLTRQVPLEKVPEGTRRVTCPQCKQVFAFSKPAATPQPAGAAIQPSAPPPPVSPPAPPLQPPPRSEPPLSQPRPPVPPQAPPRPRPAPPRGLTDIGDLFNESWQLFQRRFATLIGLYLLTMAAFMLPLGVTFGLAVLSGMAKGGGAFALTVVVGLVAGLYLGFRCLAAFLHAVIDDQLGFADALEKGSEIILPLIWVGTLSGFIIAGGFFLFIIPGVIFMVWFFFAQFILVKEDVHGMNALLKSREYVSGEWFNVALRLLLIWALSTLVGAIPLAGPVLCIAFFPYVMIFHYLIYRDLREIKGDVPFACGMSDKLKWPGVALAGFVIVPLALVSIVGFSLFGSLSKLVPTGAAVVQKSPSATVTDSSGDNKGLRVINFPQKDASGMSGVSTDPAGGAAGSSPGSSAPATSAAQFPQSASDEYPKDIHVFIYAVNYTGTVTANGSTLKELGGKPDMQYNYNMGGNGLRYGQNQIDIDYAEIPNPPSTLLGVHLKVSRNTPGKEREVLGDWRFSDKGTGKKTFTFDIPR